jgi:sugar/nucleoside kinase (ribokinase family)
MKPRFDIVALGDINLDYVVVSNLPSPFSKLLENGLIYWDEIVEIPGGSGLNFCLFAREAGYRCLLLSKTGNDVAGTFIVKWLKNNKITVTTYQGVDSPTGKAFIVRDSNDVRFLVNNKENANHLLSVDDVSQNESAIRECHVLYISGYCISESQTPRYYATLEAMKLAKSAQRSPTIVFDVVPHRIYEKCTFREFLELTRNVDILISEVATIRRFLGLGSKSEIIDDGMAEDTAQRISKYYNRFILRFGKSGCDRQILVDTQAGRFLSEETGHHLASDKRGFGDRLALKALHDFFAVLSK